MNPTTSNYDRLTEQWRARFLTMDKTRLLRLLPGLHEENGRLVLQHYGRAYGVDCATGRICDLDRGEPVSNTVQLNIYTLFGFVREGAALCGTWVSFEKLRDTSPFAAAFRRGILEPFARTFDGHAAALRAALSALGGAPLSASDAGSQLPAFECIPVQFLFWDGDDEFPAQANLLFDANATDFIHGESIVTIASVGIERLAQTAGLPLDSAAIPDP